MCDNISDLMNLHPKNLADNYVPQSKKKKNPKVK